MLTSLLLSLSPTLPHAAAPQDGVEQATDLWDALSAGQPWLRFRYRFEHVDTDARPDQAHASTVRTAFGYRTGVWQGLQATLEMEDVTPIGSASYDSGVNDKTNRAVVLDPEGTEVHQAFVDYLGVEGLRARAGRQEVALENRRFIGNAPWRQNHQSFDAVRFTYQANEQVDVNYAYLHEVRRVTGERNPGGRERMRSHVATVGADLEELGRAVAYAFFLDFDDSDGFSTRTFGLRFSGERVLDEDLALLYVAELATQADHGDNPNDVDQEYYRLELGAVVRGVTVRLGNEHMGGSGDPGDRFTTPLANQHKHNGFADVLTTPNLPDQGLIDRFIKVSGNIGNATCLAALHRFESDAGDLDYGTEIDLNVGVPLSERVTLGLRFAHFEADDLFDDTTKAMAWLVVNAL